MGNCGGGALCKDLEDRTYIGAKRSMCADCAYTLPWPPKPVDHVMNALARLWVDNPDKVAQAKVRPELRGWLVGQVMKSLHGRADVDDVFYKVNQTFGKQPPTKLRPASSRRSSHWRAERQEPKTARCSASAGGREIPPPHAPPYRQPPARHR